MTTIKSLAKEQTREIANQGLNLELIHPVKGWIYTIRNALGMTGAQLGQRLGVKKGRVSQMEQMEVEGRVTLQQLKKAAEAMDCELVYALRPRKPIEQVVYEQAKKKSIHLVRETQIQMGLEAQGLSEKSVEKEINRLVNEFITKLPRDLWSEE